jgi:hypothetical protein
MSTAYIFNTGTSFTFSGVSGWVLQDYSLDGIKNNVQNITTVSSADNSEEFQGGLNDWGTVKFKCLYDGSLPTPGTSGTLTLVQLKYNGSSTSTGKTLTGTAILQDISVSAPVGTYASANLTFKVSGKWTAT